MINSAKLMEKYSCNNVVLLSKVKRGNYYLFRLFQKNQEPITSALLEQYGTEVLDDIVFKRTAENIVLYLRYHYLDTVDMTELRSKHRSVYNSICTLGRPAAVIADLGFTARYQNKVTELELLNILTEHVDSEGFLKPLDKRIYNTIHYRSKKEGVSVVDFLKNLGFKIKTVDSAWVVSAKDSGRSFREIARLANLPKSTVHSIYLRAKDIKENNDDKCGEGNCKRKRLDSS